MSAYGVFQIFLANTTILRMAPEAREERVKVKRGRKVGDEGERWQILHIQTKRRIKKS